MEWREQKWRWDRNTNSDVMFLANDPAGSQSHLLYIYNYPMKGYYVAIDSSDSGVKFDKVLAGPFESLEAAKVTYLMLRGCNHEVD
jgi:hypothetical protein